MAFDYAAFKAGWKAGCRKYGIDPVQGATSYQVALVKAEQAKAQYNQRARWWAEDSARAIWQAWPEPLELPPFAAVTMDRLGLLVQPLFQPASDTEIAVMRSIGRQARQPDDRAVQVEVDGEEVDMVTLRDLWQEVRRELFDELTPRQQSWLPEMRVIVGG